MRKIALGLLVLVVVGALTLFILDRPGGTVDSPDRAVPGQEVVVFAGGCFWCTESDFDHIEGVVSTTSGYSGGTVINPTYEQVSAGDTGHIEAVQVAFDPGQISYEMLVDRFFRTIDPFDDGGSFCDRGYQYRSAIFVRNEDERRIAEAAKARVAQELGRPVATLILPAAEFYRAEDYHQDYYLKNPVRYRYYRGSCGRQARLDSIWGDKG